VGAYGVGSIVSILVGGVLSDRLGRRRTLLASLFGGGLLALGMGAAPSFAVFAPLLVAFGFVADLYRPAASSMLGDLLPSSQRALGFAALRTAVNLGFAVGMSVGGLVAEWKWRLLFVGDGATTLLYGILVYAWIRETRPAEAAGASAAAPAAPVPSAWRDPVFLQGAASSLLFCTLVFVGLTVLPLTITAAAGYPAAVYGLIVGLNGLLIALVEMPVVDALRGVRRLRAAAAGVVLTGLGFGIIGLVWHWSWFVLAVLLWTAGEILTTPQLVAFMADWAPPAARGRYLGLYHATWSLGLTLGPTAYLPLHARLGDRAFWPLLLAQAMVPALVLLHLDRSADRPERLRGLSRAGDADVPVAIAAEAEG